MYCLCGAVTLRMTSTHWQRNEIDSRIFRPPPFAPPPIDCTHEKLHPRISSVAHMPLLRRLVTWYQKPASSQRNSRRHGPFSFVEWARPMHRHQPSTTATSSSICTLMHVIRKMPTMRSSASTTPPSAWNRRMTRRMSARWTMSSARKPYEKRRSFFRRSLKRSKRKPRMQSLSSSSCVAFLASERHTRFITLVGSLRSAMPSRRIE